MSAFPLKSTLHLETKLFERNSQVNIFRTLWMLFPLAILKYQNHFQPVWLFLEGAHLEKEMARPVDLCKRGEHSFCV